jgi:hypothetical protein
MTFGQNSSMSTLPFQESCTFMPRLVEISHLDPFGSLFEYQYRSLSLVSTAGRKAALLGAAFAFFWIKAIPSHPTPARHSQPIKT